MSTNTAPRRKPWTKRLKWRLEFALYRSLERALGLLPIQSVALLGEVIGSLAYRCSAPHRAIVKRNLMVAQSTTAALAQPTPQEVEAVFRGSGANLLTTLVAEQIRPEQLQDHLQVDGFDAFAAAIARGDGVVLMLAHMGNWEVLTKFTALLEHDAPMAALYRPLNNPLMDDLILRRREAARMQLISARNPAFPLLKVLKKGGITSILSDQRIGNRGEFLSFCGVPTQCSRLPYLLHEKTGAALFTVQMHTEGLAQWRLTFTPHEQGDSQVAFDSLALHMQAAPNDCFWFQDRWQAAPKGTEIADAEACHSPVFARKRLPFLLESEQIATEHPQIVDQLTRLYEVSYWDGISHPDTYYGAIGYEQGSDFHRACRKAGIKRGYQPVPKALKQLN